VGLSLNINNDDDDDDDNDNNNNNKNNVTEIWAHLVIVWRVYFVNTCFKEFFKVRWKKDTKWYI